MDNEKQVNVIAGDKKVLQRNNTNIYLFCIIAIGMFLRIWHINWSLPEVFEEAFPFSISWGFWNWGQGGFNFNPHNFHYPALSFYFNFLVQAIHYFVGSAIGLYNDLQSFQNACDCNPTNFIIQARLICCLFDTGTILIIYRLGKECSNEKTGLLAALFVAINPLLIMQSHLVNVDTQLTFFTTLSLFFMYRINKNLAMKWYILTGVSIGCSAASKYTGALLILVLIIVHLFRADSIAEAVRSLKNLNLILAILIAGIVFIATNPFIFISFKEFMIDYSYEELHMSSGHLGLDPTTSTVGYYLLQSLPTNLGWASLLIIIISAIYFLWSRKKTYLFLLVFPIIYFAVIFSWQMRADRYLLPVIPTLILIGSVGLVIIFEKVYGYIQKAAKPRFLLLKRILYLAVLIIGFVLFYHSAFSVIKYHQSFAHTDTRIIAKEWIKSHLRNNAVIVSPPIGLDFFDKSYNIFKIPFLAIESESVSSFYDARWYEDLDLVIGSDYDYGRYAQEPHKYAKFLNYYNTLRTQWKLEAEIKPVENQPGPTIWLYKPPDTLIHTKYFDADLIEKFHNIYVGEDIRYFFKMLATHLVVKGKLEKAEQIARLVKEWEMNNPDTRKSLGFILYSLKQYEEALNEFSSSLQLKPKQADVLSLYGNILFRLNRIEEAETYLKKALDINQRLEPVYKDLFDIYKRKNDKQSAIELLQRYKKAMPPNVDREKFIDSYIHALESMQ
jgi:4-amino-4-deoxy-L-arabinose transferase-like glycosyltransferase/tetratricopeptide (TPR) repeat protein